MGLTRGPYQVLKDGGCVPDAPFFPRIVSVDILSSAMPEYRRPIVPGATVFFTVVTNFRRPILPAPRALDILRTAIRREREHHPFEIDSIVILPDHLH